MTQSGLGIGHGPCAAGSMEHTLRTGLTALGLQLEDFQIDQLLAYLGLIHKWNQVYNLTAVRAPAAMMTHHLLDSLAAVVPLQRHLAQCAGPSDSPSGLATAPHAAVRLLDVGSGAGLPGVVMAICCPTIHVDCVDAVAKKAAFIRQAAGVLNLPHLHGLHDRVERLSNCYNVITARAVASLHDITGMSGSALAPGGVWMAMKGIYPDAELAQLPAHIRAFHVEMLSVPGLDVERCLVWMQNKADPS